MANSAYRLTPIGERISIVDLPNEVKRYTLFELESVSGYNNTDTRMIFDRITVMPFRWPFVHLENDAGRIRIKFIDSEILKIPGDFGCTYVITSRHPACGKDRFPERYKLKCI